MGPAILFADNRHGNIPSMRIASMFEKEYSLPGSELHFSLHDRDGCTRSCQHHADVGRHVIRAFIVVLEVICGLRHDSIKELFQITARAGRGIFHNDKAAAGVLNKNCHNSTTNICPVDAGLNFRGDFVGTLALGSNFKSTLRYRHSTKENNTTEKIVAL
jgi:hypothetical protein